MTETEHQNEILKMILMQLNCKIEPFKSGRNCRDTFIIYDPGDGLLEKT